MKCQINLSVALYFITIAVNFITAAPSSSSLSGFTTFDENDRNDPSNESDYAGSLYSRNNKVISRVVNMNDSNTSSLLSHFNLTMDDVIQKMNAQSTGSQPGFHQNRNEERRHLNINGDGADVFNHTDGKE